MCAGIFGCSWYIVEFNRSVKTTWQFLSCATVALSERYQKKIVWSVFTGGTEEKRDNSGQYKAHFGHNLQQNLNQDDVLSGETLFSQFNSFLKQRNVFCTCRSGEAVPSTETRNSSVWMMICRNFFYHRTRKAGVIFSSWKFCCVLVGAREETGVGAFNP